MKTRAAAIASLACEDREYRLKRFEAIKKRADASLEESLRSIIDCDESMTVKREAVRESIGQYVAYVQKARADAVGDDRDDADDDREKFRNMAREEREDEDQDEGDDGDDGDDDGERAKGHRLDKLADLLVESGSHASRADALDFLLHDRRGTALAQRHKREEPNMPTNLQKAFLKARGDAVAFCKGVVDRGNADGVDEHALTALLTAHARKMFPAAKTDAIAFAKLYEAEETVRRAVGLAKAFPSQMVVTPVFVGGQEARDVNDPKSALSQLNELVEEQRKRSPAKSTAQLFAQVYAMRPDLAAQERRENAPRPGDHPAFPAR
jgi:hypothetical protein